MAAPDVAGERDAIADELYALRPDEFAGARDARVKEVRASGNAPLARELAQLRKPTQSAWLINLLWRDQQDVVEQFLELGGELLRAQAEASGPELRRLTTQRRELEAGLIRHARSLAEQAGVSVSASMEREAQETLSAALARPEVADEVRSGRLVKPAAYAGFGTSVSVAPRTQVPAPPPAPPPDDFQAKAAQKARERREAAERTVQETRIALRAATDLVAERARAREAAQARHAALLEDIDRAKAALAALEGQAADATKATKDAERAVKEAETDQRAAEDDLRKAEEALTKILEN
jgi:hypothetical protein